MGKKQDQRDEDLLNKYRQMVNSLPPLIQLQKHRKKQVRLVLVYVIVVGEIKKSKGVYMGI